MRSDTKIALAGNPNVGKSTVFNALTGLSQHTGNWAGKTVELAFGEHNFGDETVMIVDLPGTYSLFATGDEEEVAGNYLCFDAPDSVVVVCDATAIERNLILVLQLLEVTKKVVVCVNLMDEAGKKGISPDMDLLSSRLGVPVVGCAARSSKGLTELKAAIKTVVHSDIKECTSIITYDQNVETAIARILDTLCDVGYFCNRFLALKLLLGDATTVETVSNKFDDEEGKSLFLSELATQTKLLSDVGFDSEKLRSHVSETTVNCAELLAKDAVSYKKSDFDSGDRRIDRILTGKYTAMPIMLVLLGLILFITIWGANYPSQLISDGLFFIYDKLIVLFNNIGVPAWLTGILIDGGYKTLAWVVAVMLPPMAIFFPMFTLLEDVGYLPRVAFNLDKYFKRSCACGKQALTMCMGFGCNAVGITGCRIIDSPRERAIAVVTNNFVPCNGRFPTLIAIITMFFIGGTVGVVAVGASALLLLAVIVLGIAATFLASRLLSKTFFKGTPSAFVLEMPPYRKPQFGRVIVTSFINRTLFVLGRAVVVALPAGIITWVFANVCIGSESILQIVSNAIDPVAYVFGLDGVILLAFILGFPANEIVIPLVIMSYLNLGSMTDISDLTALKTLFVDNGWTWLTAVCTMIFSLMHWPCSTTCLTIYKETKSIKQTALAFALPTVFGLITCAIVAAIARIFGLV